MRFKKFDQSGDGVLDRAEVKTLLAEMGYTWLAWFWSSLGLPGTSQLSRFSNAVFGLMQDQAKASQDKPRQPGNTTQG